MRDKKKTLEKKDDNLKSIKKAKSKKQKLQEKGITLIALVVTIVILLILAGVTLNIALSDNGLFNKAKKAADDYNQKSIEEELQILFAEKQMENYKNKSKGKPDVTDLLEEKTGGNITEENIEEFNEYLKDYGEKIRTISNAEDFKKIGKESETEYPIDGIYVQMDNISLGEFTPIGTEDAPFTGVFNGNGKKISSLTITATEDYVGVFKVNEGTIKNLTVENCTISSVNAGVGAIAGKNTGLIENCTIKNGSISAEGYLITSAGKNGGSVIGGICGENGGNGVIINCTNHAEISGSYRCVGGICGLSSSGQVSYCVNQGNVTGVSGIGGIVGTSAGVSDPKYIISNCVNKGQICGKKSENVSDGKDIGGIIGASWINIEKCKNEADINSEIQKCGGIAGYSFGSIKECGNSGHISSTKNGSSDLGGIAGSNGGTVEECYNDGEISSNDESSAYIGGICGFIGENGKIISCCNHSLCTIKGGKYVGGIAGGNNTDGGQILNCYNDGNVEGLNTICGGIAGQWMSSIENCYNVGTITAKSTLGGVLGKLTAQDEKVIKNCYYIGSSAEHACGNDTDNSMDELMKIDESNKMELKEKLGEAFSENADGYPKLRWEKKKIN